MYRVTRLDGSTPKLVNNDLDYSILLPNGETDIISRSYAVNILSVVNLSVPDIPLAGN